MAKSFDELAKRVMSPESLARAEHRATEKVTAYLLSELRESTQASQKQLAERLGIKQPTLSKLEKKPDLRVSTLRRIIEGLGGRLELVADLPGIGRVQIAQGAAAERGRRVAAAKPRAQRPRRDKAVR